MIEKPFIHLFKTIKGQYCYDVNKDEIIQLPDDDGEFLCHIEKGITLSNTYIPVKLLHGS